ncbi:tRNA (5-methylaminomethyl-2-thiouridine)(34)-methyltransferase MnmD [Bizionia gelidisalsuginis]|uniref:tRNA (5-methylaminomethyl-2-thiouridine)(34)-methyltransferase MnmD n=1 Tax=Bizionia gelidisalsuginis TaxID=291188 RepID=A0ABY3MDS8_9FLAO|nr:tRNA (5-methylaminomethyl-2-thiouridine)(34)-methyltransferase MnmD [Bizionia gelidisalsuginis]TYC17129.1 tRNA (5-methylaminomethyl-2-thiouridine)(34)-methyltransferase MnmD [Bizionia gelidisalsuginis]
MKRQIITTDDGSKTIHIPEWNEQYHSKHGAIQEANYVYLDKGLIGFLSSDKHQGSIPNVSILEIGFGTGLNAFLTLLYAEKHQLAIKYVGVEAYPITAEELQSLNYSEVASDNTSELFNTMHSVPWETFETICEVFQLKKQKKSFLEIDAIAEFDVIYFDAFGPRVQPELWTEAVFKTMYTALKTNGVLVTYCVQGHARRAMISAGFTVEKLEGPPGKRHMLRAHKE